MLRLFIRVWESVTGLIVLSVNSIVMSSDGDMMTVRSASIILACGVRRVEKYRPANIIGKQQNKRMRLTKAHRKSPVNMTMTSVARATAVATIISVPTV